MVETIDSLDVSKYFLYENQHLLTRLINQGGMSFHWEYEGHDENARCIHTWGDGGVMEYFFKYGKGYTHARNGENAVTEYFYGSDKLIYKIIDANGGITRYRYNVFEELEVTINPEGYTRKTVCDKTILVSEKMLKYIIKRILASIATIIGIIFLINLFIK